MKNMTLAIWGLLVCALLMLASPGMALAAVAGGADAPADALSGMGLGVGVFAVGSVVAGGLRRNIFNWEKFQRAVKETGMTLADQKTEITARLTNYVKGELMPQPVAAPADAKAFGPDAAFVGQAPVVLVATSTPKAPDRGYELIFDEVNMRQSTSRYFDLLDVTGGVTFFEHKDGVRAKISTLPKGAKTAISMTRFSGGFNILDDWLRFNEFYRIDQLAADTLRSWYGNKATLMYGLITALTGIDQAFDTDDVTTINNACAKILEDLTAAGYEVGENEEFVITCNPNLKARIFKALAASFVNPNTNNNQIIHSIRAVVSTPKVAATSYWVSLPGIKNKLGEWEDFNSRPAQRDEVILGATHIWTGAYTGAIGEKKQHRKCALA